MLLALRSLVESATGAYTVTAAAGSYSITGSAATVLHARLVTASAGSYSLTGQAATILRSKALTASAGSYSLSGQAVSLLHSRLLTASAGSYAINGQSATITYTPNTGAYSITALAGSYSLSGQAATLTYAGNAATAVAETPAGRSRRFRDIYRITIDGHKFEFRSLGEAIAFLERAKAAAAQKAAEEAAKAAEQQEGSVIPVPLPTFKPPKIEVSSRELRAAASATRRSIEVVYEKALVDAEIRMLMEISKRVAEDEDVILMLM